ncbi:MAG: LacI family DNA-binding transcriptional regulator [Mycetocola sp.]
MSPESDDVPTTAPSPTLAAIATATSVSMSTVSKVLNNKGGVSAETRARVNEALLQGGYQKPGTRSEYSDTVELVFNSLAGAWAIEVIRGASQIASEHGLTVTITETGVHHGVAPGWAAAAARRQPLGIVLVATAISDDDAATLKRRSVPVVAVDPVGSHDHDSPSIGSTNWAGGMSATRHLLDLGHRRIGVVAGTGALLATRARVAGFRSAMELADVPVDSSLIIQDRLLDEADPEAALRLLRLPEPPTAIFATSDVKALGVYEAARLLKLSVPADISVVGYDDLQFARWAGPPLTTIRQQLGEMAIESVRTLLAMRDSTRRPVTRIELATSLIERESTAPPKG